MNNKITDNRLTLTLIRFAIKCRHSLMSPLSFAD